MITHPQTNDISDIKNIWQLCFGDSKEDIDFYFDTCFSFDECYVYKKGDKVVAALQMIPCDIVDGDKRYKAKYIYAVSTHPSYQSRGIMTELINGSLENERKLGTDAVVCIPASQSLFGFYSRFGFENGIYSSKEIIYKDKETKAIECDYFLNDDISQLNIIRNTLQNNNCFVSFPDKYLELYKSSDYSFCNNCDFYAFFSAENDAVKVLDCCWKNEQGKYQMIYALMKETHSDKFIIEYAGNDSLQGVVKYLKDEIIIDKPIYLGIKME